MNIDYNAYDDNYHQKKINEYYLDDGWLEIGYELAKKNNDWSELPVSKNFIKKYNQKDGILGKVKFDNVEYRPYADTDKSWYFKDYYTYFVITQGKRKVAYLYYLIREEGYGNWVDDIEILDVFEIVDKDGNEKKVTRPFNEKYFLDNIYSLTRGNVEELGVAVSDKFHKKYPFFLDLFIHYSPLSFNRITFLGKESDLDNNIAIFEVDSVLECKKRKYKVKLILDKKLYLDEAEVELIKEAEYEGDWTYITAKLLYKNSNWDSLELTDNFRKKYTPAKGIIKEIDEMNIDYGLGTETVVANKEYIKTFMHKDMYEVKYKLEYVRDENNFTEDIIVTKLN